MVDAVVAENADRERNCLELVTAFRRGGFSAEMIATGSPRKRFDRGRKLEPAMIVSLDVRDGIPTQTIKALDERYGRAPEAGDLFETFFSVGR